MPIILLAISICLNANESQAAIDGLAPPPPPDPLFANPELLQITLRGPFAEIDRSRDKTREFSGSLLYLTAGGDEVQLDISFSPRGNWRLQRNNCAYSQLWLRFSSEQVTGTLFESQNRLKLVVQCRNGQNHQRYVLKEQQAYRLFSELTPLHFATKPLQVTYQDTASRSERTHTGFFIEHRRRVGERHNLERFNGNSIARNQLDPQLSTLISVFMFMIGNTDFSLIAAPEGESCCHNATLLSDSSRNFYPVPFDFDASGYVDAAYAPEPNPDFRIRSNRQRHYRGFCVEDSVLDQVRDHFLARKDQLLLVAQDDAGVSARAKRRSVNYLGDFFTILESDRQFDRRIRNTCRG